MANKLDPTKLADWEIAEAAEASMKTFNQLGQELGLQGDELIPHGKWLGRVDYRAVLDRLESAPQAKYIDVTARTPTPRGEGKPTSAIGASAARASPAPSGSRAAARRSTSRALPPAEGSLSAYRSPPSAWV